MVGDIYMCIYTMDNQCIIATAEDVEQQRVELEMLRNLENVCDVAIREKKEIFLAMFQNFVRVISARLAQYDAQGVDPQTQNWYNWATGWMRDLGRTVST
jgi:hypothetical protein